MNTFLRLLIALVTMAAFISATNFGIINLDDNFYVVERAEFYSVKWAFTWIGDAMWTPLTWLSYWLDRSLFGEQWSFYHWHNIILHTLSSIVLFEVLRKIFQPKDLPKLFLIAAFTMLWSILPLRVESVVWVAARKDCISTLFFLLALWAWLGMRSSWGVAVSVLLMIVGGLAKASVMVFPAFALTIDWLITGKRRHWLSYVVITLISVAFALEAQWAQEAGGACQLKEFVPYWYNFLNAFCALTIYIGNFFDPSNLAFQCTIRYPALPRFSWVGLAALAAAAYYIGKIAYTSVKDMKLPTGSTWAGVALFLISILPFLGFSPFGQHAFADRFTVLPTLGLSISGYMLVADLISGLNAMPKAIVCASATAAIALLAVLTHRQCGFWENDSTLFERTLAVDGQLNGNAYDELVQYHYEFTHDYQQICKYGKHLIGGSEWQQLTSASLGPILVEAAYEIGDRELARDFDAWQYRYGSKCLERLQRDDPRIGRLAGIEYSEIIRLAYTDGQMELAREKFKAADRAFNDSAVKRNLRYILARRAGEDFPIGDLYIPDGKCYLKNRWALNAAYAR